MTATENGRSKTGNTMKIIRTVIAAVFFAAAIVLGMLAAKSDR